MTTAESLALLTAEDPCRTYCAQIVAWAKAPLIPGASHELKDEITIFVIPGFCNRQTSSVKGESLEAATDHALMALKQEAALAL